MKMRINLWAKEKSRPQNYQFQDTETTEQLTTIAQQAGLLILWILKLTIQLQVTSYWQKERIFPQTFVR